MTFLVKRVEALGTVTRAGLPFQRFVSLLQEVGEVDEPWMVDVLAAGEASIPPRRFPDEESAVAYFTSLTQGRFT